MYNFYPKIFVRPTGRADKILLAMKLTTLIIITAILQVSAAASVAQKITLSEKNASLTDVFQEISKQTGFDFLFTTSTLKNAGKVNLTVKNEELKTVLKEIFENQPLDFSINDKYIVVSKKQPPLPDKPEQTPINTPIQGKVSGEDGHALQGVTVSIKSAGKKGFVKYITTTNNEGLFSFNVVIAPGDIIQFSYVGFGTQAMPVNTVHNPLAIILKVSTSALDDIQVIGYGTTTERLSTGSEVKLSAKDIEKAPVDNILFALEGRVAGLQITQSSGVAGTTPTVKIRGTNSIAAGTSPLYILDGIPIPESETSIGSQALGGEYGNVSTLLTINPADIESVEVLKDADATSIYGSRGANGVILITTKKGKPGGTDVKFSLYTGFNQVAHRIDLMNVSQYNTMRREALSNDQSRVTSRTAPDLFWDSTKVHNWQKELIGRNAPSTDGQISVSGGNSGTRFYINAGYHYEGTVTPGDGSNNRKSIRFNLDHTTVDQKFNIGLIGGYSVNNLNLQSVDLTSLINLPPDYPLYNTDGSPNFQNPRGYPLAYLLQPFNNNQVAYNGQIRTSYKPFKGLIIKFDASFNNGITNETEEMPLSSIDPRNNSQGGQLTQGIYQNKSWIVEPQAVYTLKIKENTFNLLAGGTWQKSSASRFVANGSGYTNDALIGDLGSASNYDFSTNQSNYAYESVYGRLTYNHNDEYLANATFRRDGSSRFGPGNRFGNFGSIGLGWIFTREKAVKELLPFLSYGKLRGSLGTNGNDQIAEYGYISTYYSIKNGYQGPSIIPNSLSNANYRWEQNKKIDAGLELGFLNDRFLLNADIYRNRTDNQLIQYVISPQSGFYSYEENFPAKLQNQGIEIVLTTRNIVSKNSDGFSWNTSLNITRSENKLLSFPNIENSSYYQTLFVGKSINLVEGYQYLGLSNKGLPVYDDVNKDGQIDNNDLKVLGSNDPYHGGITNDINYKNFSLSFLIDFNRINGFVPSVSQQPAGTLAQNEPLSELGAWMVPGNEATTKIPKYTARYAYDSNAFNFSSFYYRSRYIFRLRNASLSYFIPKSTLRSVRIKQAQIFIRGQNLWTSGLNNSLLDPETGNGTLPPLRTIVFGLNCTF